MSNQKRIIDRQFNIVRTVPHIENLEDRMLFCTSLSTTTATVPSSSPAAIHASAKHVKTPTSVQGTFTGTATASGQSEPVTAIITQTGGTLSGTLSSTTTLGASIAIGGTIKGQKVVLTASGFPVSIRATASKDGLTLKGTFTSGTGKSRLRGAFLATRPATP